MWVPGPLAPMGRGWPSLSLGALITELTRLGSAELASARPHLIVPINKARLAETAFRRSPCSPARLGRDCPESARSPRCASGARAASYLHWGPTWRCSGRH